MGINVYKIPVSSDIISTYNEVGANGLFDTDNNFFWLPHDMTSLSQEPREERQTHPGYQQTYVTKDIRNPVIQIETKDGREFIKWILEEIQQEANDSTFQLYDYVHPEKGDKDQGFTIRNVVLKTIEPIGGTGTMRNGTIAGLGWRIQLEEDVSQFYG